MKSNTTNLEDFGWRELEESRKLLNAMNEQGLPEEFDRDEVTIMFNQRSGKVFFTNARFQVVMLNGEDLEMWYTCRECGREGFKSEIEFDKTEGCSICDECMKMIKENETL